MNSLPVDKLNFKIDLGFQLKAFKPTDTAEERSAELGAHTDDHYIFFLLTAGSGSMVVDFEEKTVQENQLYFIVPGQVHYRIKTANAAG